jgi:phage tail sheath protein FI
VIEHCERIAERIALLDPYGGEGPLAVADIRSIAAQLPSTHAVLLAPWIDVIDPVVGAVGTGKRLPPSGHYAGLIARTDLAVGPWAAPANQPLAWAHGLAARFDDTAHALLNEAGVVAIRPVAALGPMPLGVRTLSSDPLWVFVTVRRMMIWLRRTLRHALAWTVFEPAGRDLARAVTTAVDGLLADVWAAGGLAGGDAREAFFVHVADQDEVPPGQFLCTIGVALARPAEFITVQVRRTDNRLELHEAPEPGAWP